MSPAALSALTNGEFENFKTALMPGGIEAQEKQGQLLQATASTLPQDLWNYRPAFEALGFVFGAPADSLFFQVLFPPGWKKEPTDHSMWTDLKDDKGRIRGAIFYKAAFYDQRAHASLKRRFEVNTNYDEASSSKTVRIVDAEGEIDEKIEGLLLPTCEDREAYAAADAAVREAEVKLHLWLKTHYPDWENPLAYWTA